MDATNIERLAVLQAIYNAIGAELKTNVPDNLRGDVNNYYLDLYEQTGATGFEVRVGGHKVGTYGFAKVKAQPETTETAIVCTDRDALLAYEDAEFDKFCADWILARLPKVARDYFFETGVLVDGMDVRIVTHQATPETIKPNGTLRLKPDFVNQARAALEGGAIAGLLGGGEQ